MTPIKGFFLTLAVVLFSLPAFADSYKVEGDDITFGPKSGGDREVYIDGVCPDVNDPCSVPDPSTSLNRLRQAARAGNSCKVTVELNKNNKITKVRLAKRGC